MTEKLKAILGSVRFWIVTLTAILVVLENIASGTFVLVDAITIAQGWLIAVAGIGTLDSIAEKMGGVSQK